MVATLNCSDYVAGAGRQVLSDKDDLFRILFQNAVCFGVLRLQVHTQVPSSSCLNFFDPLAWKQSQFYKTLFLGNYFKKLEDGVPFICGTLQSFRRRGDLHRKVA